jgi:hypothetical protein
MAAKRGFRVRLSTVNAHSFGAGPRRGRVAIAVAAASAICLLASASPAVADVGTVYFDTNENAAAGETLFKGTPASSSMRPSPAAATSAWGAR